MRNCRHNVFKACDTCLKADEEDDGIEYGAERIPESTAATAAVLMESVERAKDETRRIAEECAVLKREIERFRIENAELKRKLRAKASKAKGTKGRTKR